MGAQDCKHSLPARYHCLSSGQIVLESLCETKGIGAQLTFAELASVGGQQAEDDHCKAFVVLDTARLHILFSDAGRQQAAKNICAACAGPCTATLEGSAVP